MKKIAALLISLILAGCQNKPIYKDTRLALGTYIKITSNDKRAAKIVFDEIDRIENLLSKYKPDSEISKLNRLGRLKVSLETFYIIKKAKEFCQLSNGAFDITIAPLMDLWGFTDKKFRIPETKEIKNTLKLIGSEKLVLNEFESVIELSFPGMKIDLGGIAKGFALDCAVKKLKGNFITSCLISAGQVYALGNNSGKPWKIAIKDPRAQITAGKIELIDQSVATSGDYEQYFTVNGKRFSHIMDPRTGYPAESKVISATVVASDGLTADALSTAIFVLGKLKGEELVKKFPGTKIKTICQTN
ncbi:MAG: FAD:protein FMN transferase [Candidatus Omnitrophica bacterium]|nr:FAD:protein FMN transferase [Candidatus Omnitrophota bacterium]